MSDISLLIFGKVVTIIAAGGVYLYMMERTATAKKRSDREPAKQDVTAVETVKNAA